MGRSGKKKKRSKHRRQDDDAGDPYGQAKRQRADSDSGPAQVEVDLGKEDMNASETLELALETASQPGEDQKNITQKLLEMALEKFEAEQKAGSHSVFFYYQHGMCLLELASLVDVAEFATRAVEVFGTAFSFRADPGDNDDAGGAAAAGEPKEPIIKKCDVAEATAQAWLELARLTATAGGGAGEGPDSAKHFGEALQSHQKSLELAEDPGAKLAKLLSFSKMAQKHAEGIRSAKGADELQVSALQCAVEQAAQAAALATDTKPSRQQLGACLIGLGKLAETEDEMEATWKRAVVELRAAAGSKNTEEDSANKQLLGNVLIQLGQMVEDDTEAEKCIGEACALFKQASALEPDNAKLKIMVEMMVAEGEEA